MSPTFHGSDHYESTKTTNSTFTEITSDRRNTSCPTQNTRSLTTAFVLRLQLPELPATFMSTINDIINTKLPPPQPSGFKFSMSPSAANHNSTILQQYNFDLTRTINAKQETHVAYGSEFRPASFLRMLLEKSPYWAEVSAILLKGAKYPLDRISNQRRIGDLHQAISRGNHKSAIQNPTTLRKLISTDVQMGYQLPIPIPTLFKIPHACVAPYGIIKQVTIDENGSRIPKLRMAHDQSFSFQSNTSVNSRVQKEKLTELIYGDAFRRILHYIHSLRVKFPLSPILIGKYDFKSAYRRMTFWGHSAATCCTIFDEIAYISLRLTFGGSSCPFLWCAMSEMITDLANDILNCPLWDHSITHSPHANKIQSPQFIEGCTPFARALPADVVVPPTHSGKIDSYIDDLIPVVVHRGDNASRGANAVPLAMHTVGRPVHSLEPIPRDDLLCFRKLHGEGRLSEIKTVTGWKINTRLFTVSLTDDKVIAWSTEIQDILNAHKTNFKIMDSLIGKLNHCGYIIPLARHFLHPIRHLRHRCQRTSQTISKREIKYLSLWQHFLKYAGGGMSINNLIYRRPSHIRWDDSCPIGIGGVSITGRAYRYNLPRHLQGRVSNNALEFLASMVGCWFDFLSGDIPPESCILALTDSSSACGWLHKSNFQSPDQSFHASVAEHLATIFMQAQSSIYSQHFAGRLNIIADSLSRDFHIPPQKLTPFLQQQFPQQAPTTLKIYPLPPTIISWINCRLQEMPAKAPEFQAQMPSSTGLGYDGGNSLHTSISTTTNSSILSPPTTASVSLAPSPKQSAKESFPATVRETWLAARARRPSTKWLRFLGQTVGATPAMTNPTPSTIASTCCSAATIPQTPQQNNKRPSPHHSTDNSSTEPPPTKRQLSLSSR